MTAARNFVRNNPDSHLTGYFKNLVKKGMKPNEACKRVARALVRMIFRKLRSLVSVGSEKNKRSESDMASGLESRGDLSRISNISLSTPIEDDIEPVAIIKRRTRGKGAEGENAVLVDKS